MNKAIITVLILFFTVSLCGISEASVGTKDYTVNYLDIKLDLNGKEIKILPEEPFIINGTTYFPLRALAEILNFNVVWLPHTKTVVLKSNDLRPQIEEMAKENKNLKLELTSLANGNNKETDSLRGKLVNEYKKIGEVDINDIVLRGNINNLDLTVEVNLDQNKNIWANLNNSEIRGFIENILFSIRRGGAVNARIDGEIIDIDSGKVLLFFNKNGENDMDLSYNDEEYREAKSYSNIALDTVLKDLKDKSYPVKELYFSIDDVKYKVGNEQVILKLSPEFGDVQNKWSNLKITSKRIGVEDVFRGILKNFKQANINVEKMSAYFYDEETNLLSSYDFNVDRDCLY